MKMGSSLYRATLVLIGMVAPLACADDIVAGRWEGSAQVPERELRLVVDFSQENGGTWIGSITLPGMRVKGAPLSDIVVNGSDISFLIKSALADPRFGPARFKAHITQGKMSGDFLEAGNVAPFALERLGDAAVEKPLRSTRIAKELEGEWYGEYELLGLVRKVTLKLHNSVTEGAAADFLIVGRKENHLPVDLVTQEGNFLTIESHATGVSLEGRVAKDEIKAAIIQGPLETPVTVRRKK